jgi:hypothetical protein
MARPTSVTSVAILLGTFALVACAADSNGGSDLVLHPDTQNTHAPAPASTSSQAPAASGDEAPPATPAGTTTTTAPVKKELGITWFGQEKYYWCGPGSTKMVISALVQQPPSQAELATVMGTTEGGTNSVNNVIKALNTYIKDAAYVTHEISDPPTPAQRDQLKKDLHDRIGAGFPMVANVISGWRPPGYPGGTIYHYVAIVGYDESAAKVQIGDPAGDGSGGSTWTAVPRTYWISIDDLATWIGGKGYTG